MNIALIIGILVIVALAAITVFASARRRGTDAAGHVTGKLTAETRATDAGTGLAVSDDASAEARARGEETRAGAGGVATRGSTGVAEFTPAEYEEIQVSRRQFFNRAIIQTMGISIGTFGISAIAFLYAKSSGGFGGKIDAGITLPDVQAYWDAKKEPFYVPAARTYLQPYPLADIPQAKKINEYQLIIPSMEKGIVGLYQKCVHLGCRVPWCQTSQWFECPCHGSKYSRVGEKRGGPAPRGLDHWIVTVSGVKLTIDTSGNPVTGPPIGTDTTGQGAEGPPCV
ncbi:MAG: Rieske 2Fe-2S domain-containing protein [Acidimicrobiia bacterium]|nr:Rieske 2Fe-2S domain-containing protein [Acidimicrobiia bacterium]